MPSDITGTEIIEEDLTTGQRAFRFVQGPSSPTSCWPTRSTAPRPRPRRRCSRRCRSTRSPPAARTYQLPDPFFVLATQNPIEQEGTYPLPEAQLDRFMLELRVGYPSQAEEEAIVEQTTGSARGGAPAGARRRVGAGDAGAGAADSGVAGASSAPR